jgi:hypothetical protein
MAKRTSVPPAAAVPDLINEALLELAETVLSDFFFDPENEQAYKRALSKNRPTGDHGLLLTEETFALPDADCVVRLEALRTMTRFRVGVAHPTFDATVEGVWSIDDEVLSGTRVTRTGDPAAIEDAVQAMIDVIDERELDEDEFTDFMDEAEDDEDVPLIGDDPTEPPEATALDRSRLKAIAKRVARATDGEIAAEDRLWLEQMPQILPALTESVIAAASAAKRDDRLVVTYHALLAMQLEFVRYRQDRGWEWANEMLEAYQRRLVEVGRAETIPRDDWFMMCGALEQARVTVGDEVQAELADAGFKPEEFGDTPPEAMMEMMRQFMDELARMVSSPFEVVDSLKGSGAMLPAALRSFLATELALSPHAVLREAVPLLLLDDDSAVRVAAAGALEQTAHPETLSSDALRRAITIRNWIPAADRPALDAAIRKARIAGVEIGAWPAPVRDLELYASSVDGSGAQSILGVSRTGKKGLFAGLLLRHGTGVVDGWVDQDMARGKVAKLLREAQMGAPIVRVGKAFLDSMVEHAIAASVEQDAVPPAPLMELAELLGGAEWKDRRIDIAAEADRLFAALDPAERTPEGIESAFARGLEWMVDDEVLGSWFEDGPQVQKALAKLPRTDRTGMMAVVMSDILPDKRAEWTERFLMVALWSQAATDAAQRSKAADLVQVAHALAGDAPLETIPAMELIADQTVRGMLLGGW